MKNFTNNRWLGIAIIILLLANIVTLVLLWTNKNKPGGMPPQQEQAFQFVTEQLQLTQQQQDAYKKLRDDHRAAQRLIQDSIHDAKDAFFALLQQPNVPDTVLNAAAKKCSALDEQADLLTFRHFQQVRAICTAEQQKKFDTIIKDVLRRMASGRPQGPPPNGRGPGDNMPPPPQNN